MIDPKKRLEEILNELIDVYEVSGFLLVPDKYLDKILKEFVHKDNLPTKTDIVTLIVDKMARYRTDKRFKFNARMSGKNWTLANWLAKAIRKLIEGKK